MFVWDAARCMRWVGGQADVWAPAVCISDKLNSGLSSGATHLEISCQMHSPFGAGGKFGRIFLSQGFFPLGPGDSLKHSG
jgi:hypothetical protein